jgi:hypothetical protein
MTIDATKTRARWLAVGAALFAMAPAGCTAGFGHVPESSILRIEIRAEDKDNVVGEP